MSKLLNPCNLDVKLIKMETIYVAHKVINENYQFIDEFYSFEKLKKMIIEDLNFPIIRRNQPQKNVYIHIFKEQIDGGIREIPYTYCYFEQ